MYGFLAFASGVLLSIMLQMNGGLSACFGIYHAALYIHIIGVGFALAVLLLRRKRVSPGREQPAWMHQAPHDRKRVWLGRGLPLWMYLGGAIGVITTVCCNLASLRLNLTCLTAFSLFAQLAVSCLIDVFGWLGMERRGRRALKPWSLLLSLAGIALLADRSASQLPYALAALATGASIVASRSVNARLSLQIGALPGSFVNHLVGLPLCLLAVLLVPESPISAPLPLWCWGGGILGVVTVLIANVVVPHLPASRMTLLTLCGQLLCGLLLDILARGTVSPRELAAALLIVISSQLGHPPAQAKHSR